MPGSRILQFLTLFLVLFVQVPAQGTEGPASGGQEQQVDQLNALAAGDIDVQPDSALGYARMALDLSRRLKYVAGAGNARLNQSRALVVKGRASDAMAVLKKARADFDQINDKEGLAGCALADARIALRNGDFAGAFMGCHAADTLLFGEPDGSRQAEVHEVRASIYFDLGRTQKGMDAYEKALEIYNGIGDPYGESRVHARLGDALLAAGQYEIGKTHYDAAAAAHRQLGQRLLELRALVKLAKAEADLGQIDNSRRHLQQAMTIAVTLDDSAGIAMANSGYGKLYVASNQPDSALTRHRRALAFWRARYAPLEVCRAWIGVADARIAAGNYSRAATGLESAIAIADSNGFDQELAEAHRKMVTVFKGLNDYRRALTASDKATEVSEYLRQRQQSRALEGIEIENAHQKAIAATPRRSSTRVGSDSGGGSIFDRLPWLWYAISGFAGLLALIFLVSWLRSRRSARDFREMLDEMAERLEEARNNRPEPEIRIETVVREVEGKAVETQEAVQTVDLEALVNDRTEALNEAVAGLISANEDLDTFLYRASHDLLGPLARLKGLVLVARDAPAGVHTYIDLIDTVSVYMERVLRKLIQVHDVKHAFQNPQLISLPAMVDVIRPGLRELPGISDPLIIIDDKLRSEVSLDPKLTKLILENLLENACIFRRNPDNPRPEIQLKFARKADRIIIEVRDEGIGIPQKVRDNIFDRFYRGSERSKGNGLGLHLVQLATDRLGGEREIESAEGEYTLVRVRLPEGERIID